MHCCSHNLLRACVVCPVLLQGRMPADLIRALRSTFLCDPMSAHNPSISPEDFDWAGLGAAVSGMHRTVPGVSCLLGPLEAQVSRTVLAVRRQGQHQHMTSSLAVAQQQQPVDMLMAASTWVRWRSTHTRPSMWAMAWCQL
jgi:hypothetical protein